MTPQGVRRYPDEKTGKGLGDLGRHAILCRSSCLLLLLGVFGCAHTPPAPLSAEVQAQLGTVGVVAARFAPEADYRTPGPGGAGGAVIGAAKGVGLGTLGAAACFVTLGHVFEACLAALATPVLAVGLAVDQATKGVSSQEIQEGEAAITTVLADRTHQETLRDQVLGVSTTHTPLPFNALLDQGPTKPSEASSYRELPAQGIDTVLEITVQRIALQLSQGPAGAGHLNPSLSLVVTVRQRVVKTAEGTELYLRTEDYTGTGATFTEWAANDGQALRERLDQLLLRVAGEIVTQMFGVSVRPATEPAAPADPEPGQGSESQQVSSFNDVEGPAQ